MTINEGGDGRPLDGAPTKNQIVSMLAHVAFDTFFWLCAKNQSDVISRSHFPPTAFFDRYLIDPGT